MTKNNKETEQFRNGISSGVTDEQKKIQTRFEKVEAYLAKDKQTSENHDKKRIIRDAFTMPVSDHESLHQLIERALKMGIAINKSELIRVGIKLLTDLSDSKFGSVCQKIERLKPGRSVK